MENKEQAKKAVVKMKKWLIKEMPYLELDKGIDTDSPYSKIYWLYQDVVNFMDQRNQHQTESWLDQAKWLVEHPLLGMGYDTLRYKNKLEMAIIQMGHGLDVNWDKEKIY